MHKLLHNTGMIVRPCNTAIIALAFAFYTLRPFYPDCDPPGDATRMLAVVCICKSINFCQLLGRQVVNKSPGLLYIWKIVGIDYNHYNRNRSALKRKNYS
ncbi:unnamed protein product [Oppiella nova]|uniref:Uncharacterized protein n=1 Tax=Oppiella nova TaxID=334625 RepID=A0A7R9LIQ4_9ACAR|nr:unnamed protein product [Oppiella nova]CAG2163373.1 unnamed protein product [Oppiella nova]